MNTAFSSLRVLSSSRRPLLVVLAVGICAAFASVADASCGDWLADPAHTMSMAQDEQAESPTTPEDGPAPCDGPSCRKAPEAPPIPVPVTVSVHLEKLGLVSCSSAGDGSSGSLRRALAGDARPLDGFLANPWHPPRV